VRKASRIASSAAVKAEFNCSVLGIVATVVSLIDSLGGAVRESSDRRSIIPLWKKYDLGVSLNGGSHGY